MRDNETFPIDCFDLLPHEAPMLLTRNMLSCCEKSTTVDFVFPCDSPFVHADGRIEEMALVEMLAQAFGAMHNCWYRKDGNFVKLGYLVGLQDVVFHDSAYAGEELIASITLKKTLRGFELASGTIVCGEKLIMEALVRTWYDANSAEFQQAS